MGFAYHPSWGLVTAGGYNRTYLKEVTRVSSSGVFALTPLPVGLVEPCLVMLDQVAHT